jgi:tripartite-type tricarboxylate transporter receptor subunit TctC
MKNTKKFTIALVVACGALVGTAAIAQALPAGKPVRLVLAFPAGGPNDTLVRVLAPKLSEAIGSPVVVDNRPGGGTLIAAENVAKSPPDGSTIFAASIGTIAINPSLYQTMPYDPNDFIPVTQTVDFLMLLVTNAALPAKSVSELVALAKASPGKLNYGSYGNGSSNHLGMELFKTKAGVNLVHVPYKGGAPALTDLLGGQIQVMFLDLMQAQSHIKSGKLRALAVTGATRSRLMPELPTVAESGVTGFEFNSWAGFFVPAKTSPAIVNKLSEDMGRILNMPDIKAHLSSIGAEPAPSSPQAFTKFVKEETAKWAKVVKDSGAKID